MRWTRWLAIVFLMPSTLLAQGVEGYYRYPAIHGETIVFSAEGDLWKVGTGGGVAQRLTTHAESEGYPAISPDGRTLAFSASYEGPTEVYTMPLDGGLPTRLTYNGATGRVVVYEDELQIQPSLGGDVKATEGAAAWGTPRQIGSLSGEDDGERVMIEGQVLRVEGLSSAVKVFLGDETGEVVVFIWRNILDRVDRNTGLGTPGSRVRVVGTLGIYRGNLEVQPALPNDILVLEQP